MDKLLESATKYCEILQSSISSEVANWKTEDLERAFHWAEHFKKVHSRIGQKQSVVQRLDVQLKQLGRWQLCRRFGGEEFSYDFLGHSLEYLAKALLENPVLSAELRCKILAEHVPSGNPLLTHCEEFASSALLLQTLSLMHTKITQSGVCPSQPSTATQTELLAVDAFCLQDDINWQMQSVSDSSGQRPVDRVQKRLLELSKHEKGMQVILLALTQLDTKAASESKADQTGLMISHDLPKVHDAILKWLLHEVTTCRSSPSQPLLEWSDRSDQGPIANCSQPLDITTRIWEQPPQLLAEVSECHFDFFKMHLQYLVQRMEILGEAMRYTPIKPSSRLAPGAASKMEEWEHQFETVVSHFQALFATAARVRDVCTSLIESRVPETEKGVSCLKANVTDKIPPQMQDVWSKLYLRMH